MLQNLIASTKEQTLGKVRCLCKVQTLGYHREQEKFMLRLWELAGARKLQELGLGCSGGLV